MTEPIQTERLELPYLTLAQLRALTAGEVQRVERELDARLDDEWLQDALWLVRLRARQVAAHPEAAPWLLRPMLLRDDGARRAVGYLNFHAPPDADGRVEIGYSLLPAHRGYGLAIEAVRGAFRWALDDDRVRHLRAAVAPGNERSLNLIAKLGLRHVGEQMDPEDGLELVFESDRGELTARLDALDRLAAAHG